MAAWHSRPEELLVPPSGRPPPTHRAPGMTRMVMATAASGRWTSASEGASEGATSAAVVDSTSWLDTLITSFSRRTLLVLHATRAHAGMLASSGLRTSVPGIVASVALYTRLRHQCCCKTVAVWSTRGSCTPLWSSAPWGDKVRHSYFGLFAGRCTSPDAVITTAPAAALNAS